MAYDNFQYKLENLSLYFQGGVRRSIIIFAVILLILIFPVYYLGKFVSGLTAKSYLNMSSLAVNPKIQTYDYEIGKTQRAELKDGTSVLYAAVRNKKNRDIGFYPWNYSVQILDKNGAVITPKETFESYLLPDDNKYIVAPAPANGSDMQIIEESGTQKTTYNPNANPLLTQPNVTVQNNQVVVDKNTQTMTVSALLRNEDKRFIEKIDVTYFVRDTQESILYIGTSSFNGFVAGSERDFRITNLPLPSNGDPRTVDVRWSVNYLTNGAMKLK
jgi:hypothetical protein